MEADCGKGRRLDTILYYPQYIILIRLEYSLVGARVNQGEIPP